MNILGYYRMAALLANMRDKMSGALPVITPQKNDLHHGRGRGRGAPGKFNASGGRLARKCRAHRRWQDSLLHLGIDVRRSSPSVAERRRMREQKQVTKV